MRNDGSSFSVRAPRGAVLLAVLLLAAALAGCAENTDTPPPSKLRDEQDPAGGASSTATQPRATISSSKRWHFHNYWGLSDNIVLFDAEVGIAPDVAVAGKTPKFGAGAFAPKDGTIVPPETGRIVFTVTWNGTLPERPLNVTYKAANMTAFLDAGPALPGPAEVAVLEPMADAAHTGESGWRFRIEAAPDERGVAVANGTVHVRAVAWLGRPIIIDPPHRDQWNGASVVALGETAFEGRAAKTAKGFVVQSGATTTTSDAVLKLVPANGTVVPEGAASILVRLDWTLTAPLPVAPAFVVRWSETQTGAMGEAAKETGGATFQLYRIPVDSKSTDSPYGDRSTWTLALDLADGSPAFDGKATMRAWVGKTADFPAPTG